MKSGTQASGSHLRIFSVTPNHSGLKELGTIQLPENRVRNIQFVPGIASGGVATSNASSMSPEEALKSDLVFVGMDCQT